ncbi:MAG: sigma-54 dependent transcriptional regulator, partial [Parvularculaceae bacterium]|nr:sigma-54 dependent transcriptional regulator [Parvularculaceae bacterium]
GPELDDSIRALRAQRIAAPVIACGYNPSSADAALRAGAAAFLTPQSDAAEIADAVDRALGGEGEIVAAEPATIALLALADRIARSDATVLITGESGVGKEVIAQRIHRQSPRGRRAMVSVNCAAIPDNLLESELFGHERGAFTGAVARRLGKFEEAHGGSLLLDEISEMEPRLQAKLLRALQERLIDRVGGGKPVRVDVRVIATSNRDLGAEVRRGAFRSDLYFRLNVVHLEVSPLRERPADAVALAELFAARFADRNGLPRRPLSPSSIDWIRRAPWPGNVRELENAVHRAVLLADGASIELDHDQPAHEETSRISAAAAPMTLAAMEERHILATLDACGGNRTRAAAQLGISIRTLRNKLRAYAGRAPKPF